MSFPAWPFIEAIFFEQRRHVICMKAIADAGTSDALLDWCDAAIAIIVSSRGVIQNADGYNLASVH